jgi:hypothetical protein
VTFNVFSSLPIVSQNKPFRCQLKQRSVATTHGYFNITKYNRKIKSVSLQTQIIVNLWRKIEKWFKIGHWGENELVTKLFPIVYEKRLSSCYHSHKNVVRGINAIQNSSKSCNVCILLVLTITVGYMSNYI